MTINLVINEDFFLPGFSFTDTEYSLDKTMFYSFLLLPLSHTKIQPFDCNVTCGMTTKYFF